MLRLNFFFFRRRGCGIEGKGKASSPRGGVERGGLTFRWLVDQLDGGRGFRGRKIAQHRCKFKLGEELAAGLKVGRLRLHGVEIERERDVAVNGDEFFGQ